MVKTFDLAELENKFNVRWTNEKISDFNRCVKELELIVNSDSANTLYIGHASRIGGQVFFDSNLNLISYLEGSDSSCIHVDDHKKIFAHYGIKLVRIPIPDIFKDTPCIDYMQQYVKLV